MNRRNESEPAKAEGALETDKAKLIKKNPTAEHRRTVAVKRKVVARHSHGGAPDRELPAAPSSEAPAAAEPRLLTQPPAPAVEAAPVVAEKPAVAVPAAEPAGEKVSVKVPVEPPPAEVLAVKASKPVEPERPSPPPIGTILRRRLPTAPPPVARPSQDRTSFSPDFGPRRPPLPRGEAGARPPRPVGERSFTRNDAAGPREGGNRWTPGGPARPAGERSFTRNDASGPREGGNRWTPGGPPRTGGAEGNRWTPGGPPRTGGGPREGGNRWTPGGPPRTGGAEGNRWTPGGPPRTGGGPREGGNRWTPGGPPRTGGGPGGNRWTPGGPPRTGGGPGGGGDRPPRFSRGGTGSSYAPSAGGRPPFRGRGGAAAKPAPASPTLPLGKSNPRRFARSTKKDSGFSKQEGRRRELEQAFSLKNSFGGARSVNPVPKEIHITEAVTVAELARKMNLKGSDLIGKLMRMGMMVTINQQIDADTALLLAQEYGAEVRVVSLYDETLIQADTVKEEQRRNRPPVVTVMGHVDHGKTKLLDAIRSSNVVAGEHGGITQHIGAYQVQGTHGPVTFLDTPGHEAFSLMRARGASVTDLVVLVVAADDGVMPQTVEAIRHAQDAKVPIIVAINKVDLPTANIEQVKQQLSQYNLIPEEWGGHTQFIEVSALAKTGLDRLLERIGLEAEMLDLRVGFECRASGRVIESFVDQGRGIVATLIIQEGTLKIGDSFVAGVHSGKVRAMYNEYGERLKEVTPGTSVEIIGFNGCPDAGVPFHVVESERQAKLLEQKRQELQKLEKSSGVKKVSLDSLYSAMSEGQVEELRVIIKGDVHGSVEALQRLLEKLSTDAVRLRCIHAAAGAIVESDVSLAAASKAVIIGFHVRPTPRAQALAEKERVEIRKYNIIYNVVDDVQRVMEGMLAPELSEREVAVAEVRELFRISRLGTIAGCIVKSGTVARSCSVRVLRAGVQVHEGSLSSLKRFKDDVKDVREGFECGLSLTGFNDLELGDLLHFFVVEKVARKLGAASGGRA